MNAAGDTDRPNPAPRGNHPLRIGVMLRDIGQQEDAPGIIVLNLVDELLRLDRFNRYVLLFRDRAFLDRFRQADNVETVLIPSRSKFFWDQLAVPRACRGKKLDLLFHPKHSLPLLAGCRTVMHLRGPEYWVHPQYYELHDLLYQRLFLRLFSRKATHLIAESRYAKREFERYLALPPGKVSVIHLAAHERFRRIEDRSVLEAVAVRYSLPSRFALTVTRVVQGKKFYPGKNIVNSVEAFLRSGASEKMKFVIVGRQTAEFVREWSARKGWPPDLLVPLDFVPQRDLPALYNLAELFLFPSRNESFGIPIVEAMACGCPVVTSSVSACPEIAGGAAALVDPEDLDQIVGVLDRLVAEPGLREDLSRRGLRRAREFSWRRAAEETLAVLGAVGPESPGTGGSG